MVRRDKRQILFSQKEKYVDPLDYFPFCDLAVPIIVFTQISFLVFAWTLAGFMMRSIQLSNSTAAWVQNNPSDAQLIVALISTIFALIGSFCLCKITQYALVRRLAWGPLPLATMTEWAKIAQRTISLNGDRHKWSWTLFSVAWISLLGFLTTAWVTLLAPQNIIGYYAIQANQTDLLRNSVSNVFAEVLTSSPQPPPGFDLIPGYTLNYRDTYGYESLDLERNIMEAGFSAAIANVTLPNKPTINLIGIPGASLAFQEFVSNISTGGIFLPAFDFPQQVRDYSGLSRTWSVTQQGFTANVTCKSPTPDVPGIKSSLMNSVQLSVDGDSGNTWTQYTYSWKTTCSPGVTYSTYGVTFMGNTSQDAPPDDNLLMASVCFGQDFNGLSNQSFLVLLSASLGSKYADFAQTCEVTPLVTTVQATYSAAGVVNITQPPLEQHPLQDPTDTYNTSVLLWFPAYVIWTTFVQSQGLDRNEIGESLLALRGPLFNSSHLTEDYLRGMVEYVGSILNSIAAQDANITADMVVQSNGTFYMQTFGWSFHLRSHGPSLAAISLVSLLTVALGVFTMLPMPPQHKPIPGDTWRLVHEFNPTVTMDVLLASTAGDLSRVLTESGAAYRRGDEGVGVGKRDEDGVGAGEGAREVRRRLGVVLEARGEGRPALRTVNLDSVAKDRGGVGLGLGGLRFLRDRQGGRASAGDMRRDEYIELGKVPQESTTEL